MSLSHSPRINSNIAIAQLYNIALSAGQVSTNFQADRARFGV
jgi:hypothetical protein